MRDATRTLLTFAVTCAFGWSIARSAQAQYDGECGAANGGNFSSAPTTGLCTVGTNSEIYGTGPWTWTCAANTVARCSAQLANPWAGQCGPADGAAFSSVPTSGLCAVGTNSQIYGTGPWTWTCAANSVAQCSAQLANSWAGQCGPANGGALSSVPTSGFCTVGTNSAIYGTGPWTWTCSANTVAQCSTQAAAAATSSAQKPGPSSALYANPYYACLRNFYVSTSGSDGNPGTQGQPFQTIARAQAVAGLRAGDCVNVTPGTYGTGVWVSAGGNSASSTGYVVYRCTAMDACTLTDVGAGGNGSFEWNNTRSPMTGSYVIIDGFVLSAAAETSNGVGVDIATNAFVPSVNHVWVLNSVISGYGQSGIQMNQGEYFYVVHNTIYGNANASCSAQGSGISFAGLIATPGYRPTNDDVSNPILGNIGAGFHNAVEWNVLHNNAVTDCGYDYDGNNIVMDTLDWNGVSGTVPYNGGVLIAFNVTYNAGGGGVHIVASGDVTAANNSCYNTFLDPEAKGSSRGCIDDLLGYGNTIINNIAVAIPASHGACTYNSPPYTMWNSAFLGAPSANPPDLFDNNISYMAASGCNGEASMWGADFYSCTANKCSTNPGWVNVGTSWTGSETSAPIGTNFALQPGSPAIGYGLTKSYLPSSSVDVGACSRAFTTCP